MHIPDGFLDPKTSAGLMAAGAALAATAWSKVKATVAKFSLEPVLAGTTKNIRSGMRQLSAYGQAYLLRLVLFVVLIFMVQLFDFPVWGGTSGHLMGGTLAVLFLGPWAGTLAMIMVLAIQAFFMADGGILALGANIINMAGAGCLISYYIYVGLEKFSKNKNLAVFIAAWVSVVLAVTLYSMEMPQTENPMFLVHALLGIIEGLATIIGVNILIKYFGWELYSSEK